MSLPIVFGLCSQLLMFKMLLPITVFETFGSFFWESCIHLGVDGFIIPGRELLDGFQIPFSRIVLPERIFSLRFFIINSILKLSMFINLIRCE
jgi:hypothetical protein